MKSSLVSLVEFIQKLQTLSLFFATLSLVNVASKIRIKKYKQHERTLDIGLRFLLRVY